MIKIFIQHLLYQNSTGKQRSGNTLENINIYLVILINKEDSNSGGVNTFDSVNS